MSLTNSQADAAEAIKAMVAASDAAATQSIEKAIEAGLALISAKDTAPHGTWLPFLERAGVPERKAQRLMKLAASGLKSDTVSDLGGVTGGLTFIRKRDEATKLLLALKCRDWADILEKAEDMEGFKRLTSEKAAGDIIDDLPRLADAIRIIDQMLDMFASEDARDDYVNRPSLPQAA